MARLLEEESYLAQYHAYIQEIVTGWMSTAEEKIDALDALIGEYVKNDATAFYTYEEYQTGLTALRAYIGLRAQSLTGQLEGTIPATSQGQEADPASLIDASGLVPVSYTHLDVYKRQSQTAPLPGWAHIVRR